MGKSGPIRIVPSVRNFISISRRMQFVDCGKKYIHMYRNQIDRRTDKPTSIQKTIRTFASLCHILMIYCVADVF